jgi:O-antigen/teichoic acid export membrane protein
LAFFTVFTSMLRGAQRMTAYAWLNFVIPILQVVAVFIFIQRGTSIVRLAYLLLAVQTWAMIFAGMLCFPFFSSLKDLRFSLGKLVALFAGCLPIALIAIVGILYQKLSLAMLSFIGTASMVGLFSAAARVIEAARMGHVAVFTSLYPAMAKADQDRLSQETFRFSWFLLLAIAAGSSVLIFFLAKPIVSIFFGSEYQAAIPVLKVLAFILIPYTVNSFLSLLLLAWHKEQLVLQVLVISLLLLLLLDLWLIPIFGQVGASWAMLSAEVMQAILFLLAWLNSPITEPEVTHSKGVSYELSDLS